LYLSNCPKAVIFMAHSIKDARISFNFIFGILNY